MKKCEKCNQSLFTFYELQKGICNDCFGELYTKEVVADAKTTEQEPVNEVHK